jgi:hypothetical protein
MEMAQSTPALRDLFTILFKPRETMRRILDAHDRWTIQIVVLACVCAEVSDFDARHLNEFIPNVKIISVAAIVIAVVIMVATSWVLILFLLSWIATYVGRLLGGNGSARDVRAAMAWGLAPIVWSVIYRFPLALYQSRFDVGSQERVREILLNFMAHGGCAMIVVLLALNLIFFLWCLFVAGYGLSEAHHFSTEKGFVSLAITLALPLLVIGGAVFTFRK